MSLDQAIEKLRAEVVADVEKSNTSMDAATRCRQLHALLLIAVHDVTIEALESQIAIQRSIAPKPSTIGIVHKIDEDPDAS